MYTRSSASEAPSGSNICCKDFISGWSAGFMSVCIMYPLNKTVYRQMLHGINFKDAVTQLHNEGLRYLYRGILPPLCSKTLTYSLMFGVYEDTRAKLVDQDLNLRVVRGIGGVTSAVSESLLLPLDRMQTLLSDEKYHRQFKNSNHVFFYLLRTFGIKEFYRGYTAFACKVFPTTIIFFMAKEELSDYMQRENYEISILQEFLMGALLGGTVSCLFFPFSVTKVAMQRKMGVAFENPYKVLMSIYRLRNRKILNLYQGAFTNLCRSCTTWGIINLVYERVKYILDNL